MVRNVLLLVLGCLLIGAVSTAQLQRRAEGVVVDFLPVEQTVEDSGQIDERLALTVNEAAEGYAPLREGIAEVKEDSRMFVPEPGSLVLILLGTLAIGRPRKG